MDQIYKMRKRGRNTVYCISAVIHLQWTNFEPRLSSSFTDTYNVVFYRHILLSVFDTFWAFGTMKKCWNDPQIILCITCIIILPDIKITTFKLKVLKVFLHLCLVIWLQALLASGVLSKMINLPLILVFWWLQIKMGLNAHVLYVWQVIRLY